MKLAKFSTKNKRILILRNVFALTFILLHIFFLGTKLNAQSNTQYIIGTDTLVSYADVPGLSTSSKYSIKVRSAATNNQWVGCFAHITENKASSLPDILDKWGLNTPGNVQGYQNYTAGWSHTYGNMEMSNNQTVDVEITCKSGFTIRNVAASFTSAQARPAENVSIPASVVASKVYFTINKPGQIVIDINGQMDSFNKAITSDNVTDSVHTFSLFANPILKKPTLTGSRVLFVTPGVLPSNIAANYDTMYFLPGVHDVGVNFKVYSDKKYYIPGDAIVYGTFNNLDASGIAGPSGNNIRIYGYGTISGARITHPNWVLGSIEEQYKTISISNSNNVEVYGICIIDPAFHSLYLDAGVTNVALTFSRWVKVVSWRGNGDGIGNSHLIEDCFLRTADDASYIKGNRRRCIFWKDTNAAAFHLANMPDSGTLFPIVVEDCDVIYNRNTLVNDGGVFVQRASGDSFQRFVDVTIRNFKISDPRANMPVFRLNSIDSTVKNKVVTSYVRGSSYSGITFQNVTIAEPIAGTMQVITGNVFAPWYGGVYFNNVTIGGRKLSKNDFIINQYVSDIFFDDSQDFTLTTNVDSTKGSISRSLVQSTYKELTTIILKAIPKIGYTFTGWSGDTSSTTNPLNIILRKNMVVTANYVLNVTDPIVVDSVGANSWVVPVGVIGATFQVWGGGGAGGSAASGNVTSVTQAKGGGGAGGSYAKVFKSLTPGQIVYFTVGAGGVGATSGFSNASSAMAGGRSFAILNNDTIVLAVGGAGGLNSSITNGAFNGTGGIASTTGNKGDSIYYGGNGGNATSGGTGGGGGSAGTNGNGGNGGVQTAGIAGTSGGNGATGSNGTFDGNLGSIPGGGGSGAAVRNSSSPYLYPNVTKKGGNGGNGRIIINQIPPPNYYLQSDVASTASNWNASANGSGVVLGSLTAANLNLVVDNETNATFSSNLFLGNNSKIIVSQGTTAKLTIAGASLSGTIDVGSAGTLVISTSTLPTLGLLAAGSTIVYNFTGNQTLTSTTSYANVTLSGSGIKTLANAVTLSGTLTVSNGVTLDATNTVLTGTGSINVQSGATLIVGNVGGINGFNKTTGVSTYSTGANYTFNGTNTQVLGAALPSTVNNLTLSNGNNVLALNASQTINGALLLSGGTDLLVGNNTLTLNGTASGMSVNSCLKTSILSNISIGGSGIVGTLFFDTINNALNNLTINNSFTGGAALTLGNTLKISGVVTPKAGQLATGNNLILVSTTVSGGGSIGDATGNSFVASNNYITGNVTVQRYSRPQRGYRTFGHPFSTAQNLGMLTDNFAITGLTTLGNGMYASSASVPTAFLYDPTQTAGSKAALTKLYDATANVWTVGRGLYVFVRGAGNEGMAGPGAINYSGVHNPVIIDGTGAVNQGAIVYNLGYGGTGKDNYNLIGNPYPCPINLKNVGGIGTFGTVYVYNPIKNLSLADEYKLAGGFDQYTNNGSTDIIVPSFGAFYVQNTRSNKFITFNENNKAVGFSPTYAVFGTVTNPTIRLTVANVNGDIDELKFGFDSSSTDASTDYYDAAKLGNSLFNFYSISSDKKSLAIDYRKHLNSIIPLGIQTALTNSYSIRLSELTDLPNTQVVLKDKFLNKVTTLSQVGDSYTFDITADTSSQGENRFQINFLATTLPVQIVEVTAQLQSNKKVAVNWISTTEVYLTNYKIERSNDGSNFSTVGMIASKGGGNYKYDDDLANENALPATIYYRIEAVDKDGSKMYSQLVAVTLGRREANTSLNIYPNPVHATLNAQVTVLKAGDVQLRIIDTKGKIVLKQQKNMSLGIHSVLLPVAKLAAGSYILEILSADGKQEQHFLKD